MYAIETTIALVLGFLLDLLLGDPQGWYHPIVSIGKLIGKTEACLRRLFPRTNKGELWGGVCLVAVVTVLSTAVPLAVSLVCSRLHPIAGICAETVMCYYILATKSLKTESMKVACALEQEGLEAGRKAVSMIVGRDTGRLDEAGVARAAVETVAENASDGVIAPMIYLAIGGPALGFFYKAVNTMDSMVGYRNEKYMYFGRAAAKLDDIVNYFPARLCAWFMIGGAFLGGFSGTEAFRIYIRDKRKHDSPNSAQTEAVMAGALGVRLAGDAWYFGEKHEKPVIGEDLRPIQAGDIQKANCLLYRTAWIGLLVCLSVKGVLLWQIMG